MEDMIRYTMKSEATGICFTFSDPVGKLAREVRRLVEFNFILVGVDGVDGFKAPIVNEFAHASNDGFIS